jgi:hypothetical protein
MPRGIPFGELLGQESLPRHPKEPTGILNFQMPGGPPMDPLARMPPQVKKSTKGEASDAQMDIANRAICFTLRNPPKGQKKVPYKDILKVVRKTDGTTPSIAGICFAAMSFREEKGERGRPAGTRKTTKEEDKKVMQVFHKMRPPGSGVDSRVVHSALPKKLKSKISRKTVIRRLADKGFVPERKIQKSDPGVQLSKKRIGFGKKYSGRSEKAWKAKLQAVADLKEFSYYPQELRATFTKYRASWTYMTPKEKHQAAFLRPKRWFPKKEWKKIKKQKVFGMTTSTGKCLAFLVPKPWSTEAWAKDIRTKVAPFLKRCFRNLSSYEILIDGEQLLHGPAAKQAMKDNKITTLPDWPKYSPDLNPQENVWAWAEPHLRTLEKDRDTFATFQGKCLKAVCAYPSGAKLIPGMAKRCQLLLEGQGKMID